MSNTNSYVCGKCGQEFNPPSHVCSVMPRNNATSTVNTGLYNHDIKAEIIAARDKWWIDRLNEEHIAIRLTDDQDEFTPGDYIAMPLERWKNLKKESGS